MSEIERALRILRQVRKRIRPEVLQRAQMAAFQQIGEEPPEPENEASKLFKLAHSEGGKHRRQILQHLERKFRHKLN